LRDRPAVAVCLGEVRDFPKGGALVQAICDFVHQEVTFGYEHASVARTAFDTFKERRGVCRDFAHLASRSAAA
jgi:transglutaminase-like putative cysteine protease